MRRNSNFQDEIYKNRLIKRIRVSKLKIQCSNCGKRNFPDNPEKYLSTLLVEIFWSRILAPVWEQFYEIPRIKFLYYTRTPIMSGQTDVYCNFQVFFFDISCYQFYIASLAHTLFTVNMLCSCNNKNKTFKKSTVHLSTAATMIQQWIRYIVYIIYI